MKVKPTFFAKAAEFRIWLAANHDTADEILLLFHKKASAKASMAIAEAVEQALCYGWIDGKLKSTGPNSFVLRFTPRRPGSIWSEVNTKRAKELIKQGLMQQAGLKAFEQRDPEKTRRYSYENRRLGFSKEVQGVFKKKKRAWTFFCAQALSYQRTMTFWVMEAKLETTRLKRLNRIMEVSAQQRRVDLMMPFGKDGD